MFNEFISMIISLVACGSMLKDDIHRGEITRKNKCDAIKNNKPYYIDGNHKTRATNTNEVCISRYKNGGTQYIGIKSNSIYHDTLDDRNRELIANGKKFIYKRIKNGSTNELWKWDIEKQMPYKVIDYRPVYYPGTTAKWHKVIVYYHVTEKGFLDFDMSIAKTIYEDDADYKLYD